MNRIARNCRNPRRFHFSCKFRGVKRTWIVRADGYSLFDERGKNPQRLVDIFVAAEAGDERGDRPRERRVFTERGGKGARSRGVVSAVYDESPHSLEPPRPDDPSAIPFVKPSVLSAAIAVTAFSRLKDPTSEKPSGISDSSATSGA